MESEEVVYMDSSSDEGVCLFFKQIVFIFFIKDITCDLVVTKF